MPDSQDTLALRNYLDRLVDKYESPGFIQGDPICIPHRLEEPVDIEIISFWVCTIAWGRRSQIIKKGEILLDIMHGRPLEFIQSATDTQMQKLDKFVYRTFQQGDPLYFHSFLRKHFAKHQSLEQAFTLDGEFQEKELQDPTLAAIHRFHLYFRRLSGAPKRTLKHVSNPGKGSAAKRLNMYLRWMCRSSEKGVDFGLWDGFPRSALHLPLDVHVGRVARELGLLKRKYNDAKAVLELSESVRKYDPDDPAKYDFALFGLALQGE